MENGNYIFLCYNKSNNEFEINSRYNFKVGDVVRITDLGCAYSYFIKAFKLFNILGKTEIDSEGNIFLDSKDEYKNFNWLIVDMFFIDRNNPIYCIKNHKGNFLVINGDGLVKTKKHIELPTDKKKYFCYG